MKREEYKKQVIKEPTYRLINTSTCANPALLIGSSSETSDSKLPELSGNDIFQIVETHTIIKNTNIRI